MALHHIKSGGQTLGGPGEGVRGRVVIGVEDPNKIAPSKAHGCVYVLGFGNAALHFEEAHCRILCGKGPQLFLDRQIPGRVIGQNNVEASGIA